MSQTPQRVKDLIAQGDALFARRSPILSLWQEIAENFHPMRADFTTPFSEGQEFAANLMTGAPVLAHRELSDQFAAMLRPRGKDWFGITVEDDRIGEDSTAKAWFQAKARTMKRIMYDTGAGFTRATKEGDQDFAGFGNCVMSIDVNQNLNGLLYRTWHLRDCAWAVGPDGKVDTMHRKEKLTVRSILRLWPKTASPKLRERAQRDPNGLVHVRHVVIRADEYDFKNPRPRAFTDRFPFILIVIDCENDTVLEETPRRRLGYIVPRWVTVSGSAYAHSPAAVVGLADARLLQRMTLTLLEASEKAVNPPLVAQGDQIQGGIKVYPGGVTWVDSDYDETKGEALRVLEAASSKAGLSFGVEIGDRAIMAVKQAFYLDQIHLPAAGEAMTATEIRARIEEYVRAALPLFEPVEIEYNGALCEETFNLALDNGAFGNLADMPQILQGQEIKFTFESPLQAAQGRDKATAFLEAGQLLAAAAQVDPMAVSEIDMRTAFRDALDGAQVPAKWIVADEVSQRVRAQQAQEQKMQQAGQQISQGAGVAGQVGDAAAKLQAAGLVPQAAETAQIQGAPV